MRRLLFYFGLAAIFIRFSVIHEALAAGLNLNLYLLYLVMPPALLGVLITGGIRRTLRARSALYWVGFLLWICLATAFSSWRGGSAVTLFYYARSEFIMLFVVAGLTLTWKECMQVMYTLAFAGVTDLVIGRVFLKEDVNRVDLAMGGSTIGNANDLAAHFILVMILLSFLIIAPKVPFLLRLAVVPMIGYGVLIITGTGSRGALLALAVSVLFTFIMGSVRMRVGMLVRPLRRSRCSPFCRTPPLRDWAPFSATPRRRVPRWRRWNRLTCAANCFAKVWSIRCSILCLASDRASFPLSRAERALKTATWACGMRPTTC
jgi:hypothetical protein